jgi:hypothetical protein
MIKLYPPLSTAFHKKKKEAKKKKSTLLLLLSSVTFYYEATRLTQIPRRGMT